MLQKLKIFVILALGVFISITSCSTFRNFFPLEHLYYPVFGNGYEKTVLVKIKYTNGYITTGEIPTKVTSSLRTKGLITENINIYNTNNNLLASYSKEYLDKEREKIQVKNEFWVAYEGGLVLVPEEYHHGDDWQKYIESLK